MKYLIHLCLVFLISFPAFATNFKEINTLTIQGASGKSGIPKELRVDDSNTFISLPKLKFRKLAVSLALITSAITAFPVRAQDTSTITDILKQFQTSNPVQTAIVDFDNQPLFPVTETQVTSDSQNIETREERIEGTLKKCALKFRQDFSTGQAKSPAISLTQANNLWVIKCVLEEGAPPETIVTINTTDAAAFGEGQEKEYATKLLTKISEAVKRSQEERTWSYVWRALPEILKGAPVPLLITFGPGILVYVDKKLNFRNLLKNKFPKHFERDGKFVIPKSELIPQGLKRTIKMGFTTSKTYSWIWFGSFATGFFPLTRVPSAFLLGIGQFFITLPASIVVDRIVMDIISYLQLKQIADYKPHKDLEKSTIEDRELRSKLIVQEVERLKEKNEKKVTTHYNFLRHISKAGVYGSGGLMTLSRLGVDPMVFYGIGGFSLVAGLALKGLLENFAVGLGYVLDPNINLGDVIIFPGKGAGVLEAMTASSFVLRASDRLISIKYKSVDHYENLTTGWSRAITSIPVAPNQDPDFIEGLIKEAIMEMYNIPEYHDQFYVREEGASIDDIIDFAMLDDFNTEGFALYQIWVKTLGGKQFGMRRILNKFILKKFQDHGIEVARRQYNNYIVERMQVKNPLKPRKSKFSGNKISPKDITAENISGQGEIIIPSKYLMNQINFSRYEVNIKELIDNYLIEY